MIFSILLQHHIPNFPCVSHLLPEASTFQHHINYAPNVVFY
jgi:hypothetical protein